MLQQIKRIRIESSTGHHLALLNSAQRGHLAQGPDLAELRAKLSELFNKRYVVLTANGFAAIFIALRSLSPRSNTPIKTVAAGTCFAMVNAILAAGCIPQFKDLEDESYGIENFSVGDFPNKTIVIAPDHFGRISTFVRSYSATANSFLIEDAAQSFFSRQRLSTKADTVTLSFYPTKWMNGIDGGAVLTDDQAMFEEMNRLVGYSNQTQYETNPRYNLGMSNLHAAYLLASLSCVHEIVHNLEMSYNFLKIVAIENGLEILKCSGGDVPTRFIVRAKSSSDRDLIVKMLNAAGVEAAREFLWLCPDGQRSLFPIATELENQTFSLPFHPWLTQDELNMIKECLRSHGTS